MAKECSRQPGVSVLKPFWTLEMKLFFSINFSSLFERTPKKILPLVFVKAMGRKSAGSDNLEDLASKRIEAEAHSVGISCVVQIFSKSFTKMITMDGQRLKGKYDIPSSRGRNRCFFFLEC